MNMNAKDINKVLEHLALQEATDRAQLGLDHGSTVCRLPAQSWQADMIRKTADMPQARNPMELRSAMQDPGLPVIFVPAEALVTRDIIDRICIENPLNKMIIWEAD